MFRNVAVFGLGLLGGSVCKALKEIDRGIFVSVFGRNRNKLAPALEEGMADRVGDIDSPDIAGAELIVVSAPVAASINIIINLLKRRDLGANALLIDVGSVKREVIRRIEKKRRSGQFIGCHPMAGSEKTGYEFSRADLFKGASVIITPHSRNREGDIAKMRLFWESLGAKTVIASPEDHDRFVAYTSHVPHILACALVGLLMGSPEHGVSIDEILPFIGNGFRDVTRISSGSPEMWRDIVTYNRKNIAELINILIKKLGEMKGCMKDADFMNEYFSTIKRFRDSI